MKNIKETQELRDELLLLTKDEVIKKHDEVVDALNNYKGKVTKELREAFGLFNELLDAITFPVKYTGSVIELSELFTDEKTEFITFNQMKFIQETFMKLSFTGIKEAKNIAKISKAFEAINFELAEMEDFVYHSGSIIEIKEQEDNNGIKNNETIAAMKRADMDVSEYEVKPKSDEA